MTMLTESILIESKTARNNQLSHCSQNRAKEILVKIKSLYFAVWQGTGIATTEQLAEFLEIYEPATIRQVLTRHKDEFESDGVKTLRGQALKDVRDKMSRTSKASNLTVWTPRAALRLAMLLQNCALATAVRTSLLNAVEQVIPTLREGKKPKAKSQRNIKEISYFLPFSFLAEIATNSEQPNLFVYQFQKDSLLPPSQT